MTISKLTIPRVDADDPHSAIDYATLGATLELNANIAELTAFAVEHYQSTDRDMAPLAVFALFMAKAREQRLRGNISTALVAERNAQTIYEREIRPDNRW
jgi:hypothetical protein